MRLKLRKLFLIWSHVVFDSVLVTAREWGTFVDCSLYRFMEWKSRNWNIKSLKSSSFGVCRFVFDFYDLCQSKTRRWKIDEMKSSFLSWFAEKRRCRQRQKRRVWLSSRKYLIFYHLVFLSLDIFKDFFLSKTSASNYAIGYKRHYDVFSDKNVCRVGPYKWWHEKACLNIIV